MSAIPGASKPRKPRNRATKRNVAQPGYVSDIRELPDVVLTDLQATQLLASFLPLDKQLLKPTLGDDALISELKLLAGSYQSWKAEPNPSKSEASYQLQRLAVLAAKQEELTDREREERMALIHRPNDVAQVALLAGLQRHPRWPKDSPVPEWCWLRSPEIDWTIVSEAASDAASLFSSRGDSANAALHATVSELIRLYRANSGCRPVIQKKGQEPPAIYRLAYAFFEHADPNLAKHTISSAIERALRARNQRSRSAQSFQPTFREI